MNFSFHYIPKAVAVGCGLFGLVRLILDGAQLRWSFLSFRNQKHLLGGDSHKNKPPQNDLEKGYSQLRSAIENWENALADTRKISNEHERNKSSDNIRYLLKHAYILLDTFQLLHQSWSSHHSLLEAHSDSEDSFVSAENEEISGQLLHQHHHHHSHSVLETEHQGFPTDETLAKVSLLPLKEPFTEAHLVELFDIEIYRKLKSFLDSISSSAPSQEMNSSYLREALTNASKQLISCRKFRTKFTKCESDEEFLAKLSCIREAFDYILSDSGASAFFISCGYQLISEILIRCEHESSVKPFEIAYLDLISYFQGRNESALISVAQRQKDIMKELSARNVKSINFYDLVLDFSIMDAFDDMESPPSSVLSVLNNGWLPSSLRMKTLETVVWSVIRSKASMLDTNSSGFMSRFYSVTQHFSPVLACGLLCSEKTPQQEICVYFKTSITNFIQEIFSSQDFKFSTKDSLSFSILSQALKTVSIAMQHFHHPCSSHLQSIHKQQEQLNGMHSASSVSSKDSAHLKID